MKKEIREDLLWPWRKEKAIKGSKEARMKRVFGNYIKIAFRFGKMIGKDLEVDREGAIKLERLFNGTVFTEANLALRKAGVIPLDIKRKAA